jgi:hypothetical protein
MQILNIKKHAKENINQFVDFNIQNHQWNIQNYYCIYMNKIVCQTMVKIVFKFIEISLIWD